MGKVGSKTMVCLTDYISPQDAAQLIGCTPGRIYQMIRGKEFRDVLRFGKHTVIGRKEAEKVANNPAQTGRPRKKLAS